MTIEDGKIHISKPGNEGKEIIDESYLSPSVVTMPNKTVSLGDDEYFVLGDNRTNSYDSRGWGPLGKDFIVGRTLIRLLPLSRISLL